VKTDNIGSGQKKRGQKSEGKKKNATNLGAIAAKSATWREPPHKGTAKSEGRLSSQINQKGGVFREREKKQGQRLRA